MKKDIEKDGIEKCMFRYTLSARFAVDNLIRFLVKKHPEVLDEVMSEVGVSEHTVSYSLNHITHCVDMIVKVAKEADELLEGDK